MAVPDHKPVMAEFDFVTANDDATIIDAHCSCCSRVGSGEAERSKFSIVAQKGCRESQFCVVYKNTHHVAKVIDALNHGIRFAGNINRLKTAGMHHEAMQAVERSLYSPTICAWLLMS